MIMVSISLVMSVIVTNIHLRKDTRQTLPVFLRPLIRPRPKRSPKDDDDVTRKKFPPSDNKSDDVKAGSLSFDDNADLARFSLFIDPDFSRGFRSGSSGDSSKRSGHVTVKSGNRTTFRPWIGGLVGAGGDPAGVASPGGGGDVLDSGGEDGESLSRGEEWVALAKYLDRLFFWLFVIASASSLSAIFISIPQGIDPEDPGF